MTRPFRFARAAVAIAVAAAAVALDAQPRLSVQDADRFQSKLTQIVQYAPPAGRARTPKSTQVTDVEVNAYLKYRAGNQIPVGIVDPLLTAMGNGRVSGRATVDLDAVRAQKKRAWTDPMGYLTGRLPVTAVGTLTTEKGVGRFRLESAAISGLAIPKSVLQELLSYYSRTSENPAGINMDDPFELPAGIREIKVGQGNALVIQ
jgi:hypothetical protein